MTAFESSRHTVEKHDDRVIKTFEDPVLYEKERTCYEALGQLLDNNDEKLSITIPYMGQSVSSVTRNIEDIVNSLKESYTKLPYEGDERFNTLHTVFESTWKKISLFPVADPADEIMNRLSGYLSVVEDSSFITCHSDLHRGNILHDGTKINIVDWEHASYGTPENDWAVLAVYSYAESLDETTGITTEEATSVHARLTEAVASPHLFHAYFALRAVREASWWGKMGEYNHMNWFLDLAKEAVRNLPPRD